MNPCLSRPGDDLRGPVAGLIIALPLSLAIWSVVGLVAAILT